MTLGDGAFCETSVSDGTRRTVEHSARIGEVYSTTTRKAEIKQKPTRPGQTRGAP